MKEYQSLESLHFSREDQVVLAMGFFDGAHLAHQRIFSLCRERARERGGLAAVFSFQNHPGSVLHPENSTHLITPYPLKRRWFNRLGMDAMIAIPFTHELSGMTAEAFVENTLVKQICAQEIVVGFNFCFGRGRKGTAQYLQSLSPTIFDQVFVVERQQDEGAAISSSRIRQTIAQGDLDRAARWLGRSFQIAGEVIHGDGRGRGIGFPTANLNYGEQQLPPNGIYGVRVRRGDLDATPHWGVMNIGVIPTFKNDGRRTVEIHILDYEDDLYGDYLIADVLQFIRDERKFSGVPELVEWIRSDIESFRRWIAENESVL